VGFPRLMRREEDAETFAGVLFPLETLDIGGIPSRGGEVVAVVAGSCFGPCSHLDFAAPRNSAFNKQT
jgi:hypothetical protein